VKSPAKNSVTPATPDVLVANGGTVFTFCPLTTRAKTWIDDNVQTESYHWLGNVLVVEYRYACGLALGMQQDGLILR
jgi:hypothetical protein